MTLIQKMNGVWTHTKGFHIYCSDETWWWNKMMTWKQLWVVSFKTLVKSQPSVQKEFLKPFVHKACKTPKDISCIKLYFAWCCLDCYKINGLWEYGFEVLQITFWLHISAILLIMRDLLTIYNWHFEKLFCNPKWSLILQHSFLS